MKVELAHDSLALKIYDKVSADEKTLRKVEKFISDSYAYYKSRGALLTKEDFEYINPYLEKIDISRDEHDFILKSRRSLRRKRNALIMLISAIFFIVSATAVYALVQKNNAENSKELAIQNEIKAKENEKRAEAKAVEALEEKARALKQKNRADSLRGIAEIEKKNAQTNLARAKLAEQKAIDSTRAAIIARADADSARADEYVAKLAAQKALRAAQEEKNKADIAYKRTLIQYLAAKSLQIKDTTLKALLALQAYTFLKDVQPNYHDPSVYTGLYQASKSLLGPEFNEFIDKSKAHKGAVRSMLFNKDGKILYSTGSDGSVLEWKLKELGETVAPEILDKDAAVNRSMSPDKTQIMVSRGPGPKVEINKSGTAKWTPDLTNPEIIDLGLDSTQYLAGNSPEISFFSLQGTNRLFFIKENSLPKGHFLRNSREWLLGLNYKSELLLWNLEEETFSEIPSQDSLGSQIFSLALNMKGETLAVGDEKGTVWIWQIQEGDDANSLKRRGIELSGHKARVSDLEFNINNQLASSSYDGSIQVWDLSSSDFQGKLPLILSDHDNWIMDIVFSPNGQELISGSREGEIKRWPIELQKLSELIGERLERELTAEEWKLYIGSEISQTKNSQIN
ncbi:MAG: hypothetical protein R8P61_08175 [Bacteroidia bacterium]|nr:hypothetical protein [Bacteroidia bacterium]